MLPNGDTDDRVLISTLFRGEARADVRGNRDCGFGKCTHHKRTGLEHTKDNHSNIGCTWERGNEVVVAVRRRDGDDASTRRGH